MVQLKLAMSHVKDQKHVLAARANIKKTWDDLLSEAKIEDREAFLTLKILGDPTQAVVALILVIYQIECFVYKTLNHASRFKDESKVVTLGAFGAALYEIIMDA